MNIFLLLPTVGFFLWSIRSILFWVNLWQLKEYRLDRLRVHFRDTIQGRKILFSPLYLVWILFAIFYGVVILRDSLTSLFTVSISLFLIIQGAYVIWEIGQSRLKRPKVTIKTASITFLSLLSVALLFIFPLTDVYLWFVILEFLTIFVVALFVYAFSFPTEIYIDILSKKAHDKILKKKKLFVIAVSGSYGKSSTKEYLAHILSARYAVVKTPLSNNTRIGIATTILNCIKDTTEIFIVEMGAYKKGEIAELCQIVRPNISITTAVSDQHISLYGSFENILASESELLHALPKDGFALFNGNNEGALELAKKTKVKKIFYKVLQNNLKEKADIFATKVLPEKNGVTFTVHLKNKSIQYKTPLIGAHNVENILPTLYIAQFLGLSDEQIKEKISTLSPLQKTMVKLTLQNGAVVIDDTFNGSPESVKAALDYISLYNGKRIFVLQPLIELGQKASLRHKEIGKQCASATHLFLTNKNFYKEIMEGLESVNGTTKIVVAKPGKIAELLQTILKKGDIALFEGKEAGVALHDIV